MADYLSTSPSPRSSHHNASGPASIPALQHATPVHSAHNSQHSLRSSTSSRTHGLSLHEYRKLQNTPTSQSATPPGKTLRRKAAAPTLNGLERAPSVKRSSGALSRLLPRPLHLSLSAHQLTAHQPLPPSPPDFNSEQTGLLEKSFRSQSAEPSAVRGSASAFSEKVSNWKPIKRLPKPQAHAHLSISASIIALPPSHATPTLSTDNVPSSDAQTTPSTFSLSRFPQPPYLVNLPHSPPNDENAPPRLNTSFTTTAPATPPATPAVIHYRGASFDLVNPHDSLLFHDIETPSRDLDSTDYSPLRSSEEPLLMQEDMAPRRALYSDLDAAYSSIRRREESPNSPHPETNTPLPPVPAFLSPNSSNYPSPIDPYDSSFAVSPLRVNKRGDSLSRASLKEFPPLKHLARTFTKRFGKSPEPAEQELEELPTPTTSPAIGHFEGDYPRPLDESYATTFSPIEEYQERHSSYFPTEELSAPDRRVSSAPLASMVPDDSSFEIGRGQRLSVSTSQMNTKPYYEEVESLYPSSSIYEGEVEGGNPPSLYSKRMSHAFRASQYGETDASGPYNRESVYSYSFSDNDRTSKFPYANGDRMSSRFSRRLTTDFPRRSQFVPIESTDNTDTISKFIDQYDSREATITSLNASKEHGHPSRAASDVSELNEFDFGIPRADSVDRSETSFVTAIRAGRARKPTITQAPGSPPHRTAPLEPAFEYDEIFNQPPQSETFSPISSYGDTRNLLNCSEDVERENTGESSALTNAPQPLPAGSSSYSQFDEPSHTQAPQEALDQAEQIFDQAESSKSIPAIWSRHSSEILFRTRSKQSAGVEGNEEQREDWETVGEKSRLSIEEDQDDWETVGDKSRNSRGNESLPDYHNPSQDHPVGIGMYGRNSYQSAQREYSSGFYNHPSPLLMHENPFDTPPPALNTRTSVRSTPGTNRYTPGDLRPPGSTTVPAFSATARGHNERPYFFMPDPAPWAREITSPYALSEKETQELLNSGPNDDIFYEDASGDRRSRLETVRKVQASSDDQRSSHLSGDTGVVSLSPLHKGYNSVVLGQASHHDTGSNAADSSTRGPEMSLGPEKKERRVGFSGFYADPNQTSSRSIIRPSRRETLTSTKKTRQRVSLQEAPVSKDIPDRSSSIAQSSKSRRSVSAGSHKHRHGRSAVPGQTKLREMVLAPGSASSVKSHETHFSDFMRADRPTSSTHTDAPLRPSAGGLNRTRHSAFSILTPHLRNPERPLNAEEEEQRSKLSWILFGFFCVLPPLMILFRWFGDPIIAWMTGGRFGHASVLPKRVALYAGVPLNISIVIAISVPIGVLIASGKGI